MYLKIEPTSSAAFLERSDSTEATSPVPKKKFGKHNIQIRAFNSKWFGDKRWSDWLHWERQDEKASCLFCRNVYILKQLGMRFYY